MTENYNLIAESHEYGTDVSFPWYGLYLRGTVVRPQGIMYPFHTRRRHGDPVLDEHGAPIMDQIYHPMAAYSEAFEQWLRETVERGEPQPSPDGTPGISLYLTPRTFAGSSLCAFVCMNWHGIIVDDLALKMYTEQDELRDETGLVVAGSYYLTVPHAAKILPDGTKQSFNLAEFMSESSQRRITGECVTEYRRQAGAMADVEETDESPFAE